MKFFFPIFAFLIAGALFFTIISPWYGQVSELKVDVAAYNVALANSKYLEQTQQKLLDQYNGITVDDKTRLEHFLPSSINNIEFILQIEQIANVHNMPIKNIKFDNPQPTGRTANGQGGVVTATDPKDNKPYGTFPLEFSTSGTYDTFLSFLKDLEHNLRIIDIQSISFVVPPSSKEDPNPNTYEFTFKVNTYWLK
jgi:hypothetical protein